MPDDDTLVYALNELVQDGARVMAEIQVAGKPAFITSYGRFIAIIRPFAPGQVEQPVLAEMAREIVAQLTGKDGTDEKR